MCYRTPATVMEAADAAVTSLGHPPVYPVSSVRDLPDCLRVDRVGPVGSTGRAEGAAGAAGAALEEAVLTAVREEMAALDEAVGPEGGRIALIAPDPEACASWLGADAALAAAMEAPGGDVLRSRLAVMGPVMSKGLEFDIVVLVEPGEIGRASPGDLYVAMTRPTRRLRVVSSGSLPSGLTAP